MPHDAEARDVDRNDRGACQTAPYDIFQRPPVLNGLAVTQQTITKDRPVGDEHAGNMMRSPLPSTKRTTLPAVGLPSADPTKDASICRMSTEKNWKSGRLHSIGIMIAIGIIAPRHRDAALPAVDTR